MTLYLDNRFNKIFKGAGLALAIMLTFSLVATAAAQRIDLPGAARKSATNGLVAALRATMTYHPAIKGKQAERDAQRYGIDSAKAKRYPSLSAQVDNIEQDQGALRLDQPLWAFGKIDAGIAQASANFDAQQWQLLKVQRALIEETAVIYAKIGGIKQRQLVAQANIDEHQRLYQQIERRKNGQLASQADVRFAYSRLLQARSQKQLVAGELLVANTELQALTQIAVKTDVDVDPGLAQLPSSGKIERLVRANSADILFKRQQMQVVKTDVKSAELAIMPTVSFRVEYDVINEQSVVDETRTGFVIEGNFEGLGFVSRGRVNQVKSRLSAARFDLDSSLNDALLQVNTLMLNRQVQDDLINSQNITVAAVEQTMASFLRQYKSGRKSWVEVLNTQRELTELRLQLAQMKSDWLILSLRVASIVGGLDQLAGLPSYDK